MGKLVDDVEHAVSQATQAVKDYLATLDDAAFGAASDVTQFQKRSPVASFS
jgi:hypothetical protein